MNFYYDPTHVQTALRAQVEHYFSTENLVRDVYLRRRMDIEGYIPCEMLFGFPRVRQMCFSIEFMLEAVKGSHLLDVDFENEKIRVRGDWKKWLFPSSDGTLGVPLYSKFPRQQLRQQQHPAAMPPLAPSATAPFSQGKGGVDSGSDSSNSTSALSSDSEESDASPSIPSTPTRQSKSPSPAATPSSKAGLSVTAPEWTPTFA